MNSLKSGRVVTLDSAIAGIPGKIGRPQISDPIIVPDAINVIDQLRRGLAVEVKPNDPMDIVNRVINAANQMPIAVWRPYGPIMSGSPDTLSSRKKACLRIVVE